MTKLVINQSNYRKRKEKLLTVVMITGLLFGASTLFGSDNGAAFLRQALNPETAALGTSGVSFLQGTNSQLVNPAGLSHDYQGDIHLQLMGADAYGAKTSLFQGTGQLWGLGVGLSYLRSAVNGIPETTRDPLTDRLERTDRNLGYSGDAIIVGIGKTLVKEWKFINRLSVGANGKRVQEKAAGYRAVGTGADLGLQADFKGPLAVGISVQNIIKPELRWNTPSKSMDTVPTIIQIGTSYSLTEKTVITLDTRIRDNRNPRLLMGAAYQLTEEFVLRGGINDSTWSLGTGMQFGSLGLDFTWIHPTSEGLEDLYQIAVNYQIRTGEKVK